jgi:hypothetical protein
VHALLNVNEICRTWTGPTRRAVDVNHLGCAKFARGVGFPLGDEN